MDKKSAFIISGGIIIGFLILGLFINNSINSTMGNYIKTIEAQNKTETTTENKGRYELIRANDNNILIFDTQTGDYWRKFIKTNEGPTNWQREAKPDNMPQ